jgi:hypothetical protein
MSRELLTFIPALVDYRQKWGIDRIDRIEGGERRETRLRYCVPSLIIVTNIILRHSDLSIGTDQRGNSWEPFKAYLAVYKDCLP